MNETEPVATCPLRLADSLWPSKRTQSAAPLTVNTEHAVSTVTVTSIVSAGATVSDPSTDNDDWTGAKVTVTDVVDPS